MKKHNLDVYRKDTLKKATFKELESILSGKLPKEDFVLLCRYCHAEAKWRKDELKYMRKKLCARNLSSSAHTDAYDSHCHNERRAA